MGIRGSLSFLRGAYQVRSRSSKALILGSLALMLAGIGMLVYPVATHTYSAFKQNDLNRTFESPEFRRNFQAGQVTPGQALTRIVIQRIGVNALIVEGTEPKALRAGAGHYSKTALPCQTGNVGIAGHRTTYGKPFSRLDELRPGDEIQLITPSATCTYTVIQAPRGTRGPRAGAASWITTPSDGAVLDTTKVSSLTLTTCHPKGSAKERLILRATLTT